MEKVCPLTPLRTIFYTFKTILVKMPSLEKCFKKKKNSRTVKSPTAFFVIRDNKMP